MDQFTPREIPLLLALTLTCCAEEPGQPQYAPQWAQQRAQQLFHQAEEVHAFFSTADQASQLFKRHMDPQALMDVLDPAPGSRVADIGAGIGYFTFRIARAVGPDGRVFALDVQETAIEVLRQRMSRRDLNPFDNVEATVNSPWETGLPADSLDLALMAHLDFYMQKWMQPESKAMLRDTFYTLRPGGRLVVAQYLRPGDVLANLQANFQEAGFVTTGRHQPEESSWIFSFVKPVGPPSPAARPLLDPLAPGKQRTRSP